MRRLRRRAKGEQESRGRLAWRLDLVGLDHLGDFEEDRANNVSSKWLRFLALPPSSPINVSPAKFLPELFQEEIDLSHVTGETLVADHLNVEL